VPEARAGRNPVERHLKPRTKWTCEPLAHLTFGYELSAMAALFNSSQKTSAADLTGACPIKKELTCYGPNQRKAIILWTALKLSFNLNFLKGYFSGVIIEADLKLIKKCKEIL
jgi:hypothetical protein